MYPRVYPAARWRALGLAAGLLVSSTPVHAVPTFASAARALPPGLRRELLGGEPAPALVLTEGAPAWRSVSMATLDALPLRSGVMSFGATVVPWLDRSRAAIGATEVTDRDGLTGRGVVVAVVDTGVDVTHDDLRAPDGSTRVAWLLDYSRPPAGIHPDLESRYALPLDGALAGAVYAREDLDAMLRAGIAPPGDVPGHGTYVASLAAGNGRATGNGFAPGRYVGIAPEATVVAVRAVAAGRGAITDAALVAGATFAFDRAASLGMPAVLNLSEGTHLGAHDGDSPLERALTALVSGGTSPGRAVVVAAGNDGGRPVHARAELLPGEDLLVDFRVPAGAATGPADVVGISLAWDSALALAVRAPDGSETPLVPAGEASGYTLSAGVVSVANATDGRSPGTGSRDATVLLAAGADAGRARDGGTWTLRLQGSGRVDAWVFLGSAGFAPPHATAETTVAIPATTTGVVAVGALTTRPTWVDGRGQTVTRDGTPGAVATFSARGPDRLGVLRPDLLAPGEMVVGALSHQGRGTAGLLSEVSLWADDGEHAAGAGTSSAAPHVTGAMALLLQALPALTQRDLLAALAGSARGASVEPRARWNPAEAWGAIDLPAALAIARASWSALSPSLSPSPVDPAASELTTAADVVAPGASIDVALRLVAPDGTAALGRHAAVLRASAGVLTPPTDIGGGRQVARYTAAGVPPGAVVTLEALVDGVPVAPRTVRVARDPTLVGAYGTAGGCTVDPGRKTAPWGTFPLGPLVAGVFSATARGARRGTRRGTSGRRVRSPRRQGPPRRPPPG